MSRSEPLLKLLQRNLSALPSPFAQLVHFASLRDSYTGRYLHEGWATVASTEEVHETIREIHLGVFDNVIQFRLESLCKELQEHFKVVGEPVEKTAVMWRDLEPFREMVPAGCSPVAKELFISQMRTALGVLLVSPDLSLLPERVA